MTSKEKVIALFDEIGLGYALEYEEEKQIVRLSNDYMTYRGGMAKVDGYTGFYTDFVFDGNGEFKSVGIWE
jgi:hypothetical protein